MQAFIESYLTFDYGLAFLGGSIFFLLYMIWLKRSNITIGWRQIVFGIAWTLYLIFLFGSTLLNRKIGIAYGVELELFWSYKHAIKTGEMSLVWQMFNNVLVFIPWGIFWAEISKTMKKMLWNVWSAFLASLFIEEMQLIFKCGLFEFDDIFHNVLGGVVGFVIWWSYDKVRKTRKSK